MNFPEEGWMLPHEELERYVTEYGGNPFVLRLKGTALGHDPQEPRLDPLLLRDQVHKFANHKSPWRTWEFAHMVGFGTR